MAFQPIEIEGTTVWWDAETQQMSQTNPTPNTFGGMIGYTPTQTEGVEGSVINGFDTSTIAGYPASAYLQRPNQSGGYAPEVLNPATGQWETGVRVMQGTGVNVPILPKSVGVPLGGQEINEPPPDSWMDKLGSMMPLAIGGFAGLAAGAAGAAANAADPLSTFMQPGASGSFGPGLGGETWLGAEQTGAGMDNFFGSIMDEIGVPWGEGTQFGLPEVGGSGYTIDMSGHAIDAAGNVVNGTDGSIWDYVQGAMQSGNLADLARVLPSLPPGTQTAIKAMLGSNGGSSGGRNIFGGIGGGVLDGIFGEGTSGGTLGGIGSAAINSIPALLAYQTAKSQRDEARPYIDRMTALGDEFGANRSGFIKSLTDPYDQASATGLGNLTNSLSQRGVYGSSFGNNDLANYGMIRDQGRGNLVAQATNQGISAESGLLLNGLNAKNAANTTFNNLVGTGLSASGRMFQPAQDPFNLKNLFGVA